MITLSLLAGLLTGTLTVSLGMGAPGSIERARLLALVLVGIVVAIVVMGVFAT